jgi:hypothetical protein
VAGFAGRIPGEAVERRLESRREERARACLLHALGELLERPLEQDDALLGPPQLAAPDVAVG